MTAGMTLKGFKYVIRSDLCVRTGVLIQSGRWREAEGFVMISVQEGIGLEERGDIRSRETG